MRTRVVNLRDERCDVRICRPGPWGNPFKINACQTRSQVIIMYEGWLLSNLDLLARLPELVGKRLGCWCAPQACHGDVLVRLIGERGLEGQ